MRPKITQPCDIYISGYLLRLLRLISWTWTISFTRHLDSSRAVCCLFQFNQLIKTHCQLNMRNFFKITIYSLNVWYHQSVFDYNAMLVPKGCVDHFKVRKGFRGNVITRTCSLVWDFCVLVYKSEFLLVTTLLVYIFCCSKITHHVNVPQCLGLIGGHVWYLGVAKPCLIDDDEGKKVEENVESRSGGHLYTTPWWSRGQNLVNWTKKNKKIG